MSRHVGKSCSKGDVLDTSERLRRQHFWWVQIVRMAVYWKLSLYTLVSIYWMYQTVMFTSLWQENSTTLYNGINASYGML